MNIAKEMEELRREVALLRAEHAKVKEWVNEVRPFLSVEVWNELPGKPACLHIEATAVMLSHPAQPNYKQALFRAGDTGPLLELWGRDQQPRLRLQVVNEAAQLDLFTQGLKPSVQLRVQEPEGRGEVNVFEAGKPRATMKATEPGASVAVAHDDGNARMMMFANAESGDLIGSNQDMRTSVKISTDFQDGAVFALHGTNVRPVVFMTATSKGGAVMVSGPQGNLLGTLPPLPGTEE